MFFVYVYFDPQADSPCYVGKGQRVLAVKCLP